MRLMHLLVSHEQHVYLLCSVMFKMLKNGCSWWPIMTFTTQPLFKMLSATRNNGHLVLASQD
jgi:hypothetical protein